MPPADEQADAVGAPKEVVARAFGAENRARLLARYFDKAGKITAANAWQHVYRLLLWIDRTTALAHCYESDKSQPGRPWYARSLAFHDWVSTQVSVSPANLAEEIDWLFREAVKDLAARVVAGRSSVYERQRAPYAGRDFPEPGEDPELAAIIREALGKWMPNEPPDDVFSALTRRIHAHLTQENKRKNLVGEGFEDVIAAVMCRLPFAKRIQVRTRVALHELAGFHRSTHEPSVVARIVRCEAKQGIVSQLISGEDLALPRWSYRSVCRRRRKWNNRFVCRLGRNCKRSCSGSRHLSRDAFLPAIGRSHRTYIEP